MRYIVPTTITDAMLVDSSVAEDDYTAWSAATAYVAGDRAIRAATHSIYERLVDGTTATEPENDAVNWARVGPTNRWAMLDGAVGTATTDADSISITLAPGVIRGLALLDLDAESVTVEMTIGATVVYSASFDPLAAQEDCDNWFDYFFEAIARRSLVILTDLPPYGEAEITVTATSTGGTVSIGSCVVGMVYEMGDTMADASISITDYSRKDVDEFGAISVAERAYSKRMTLPVVLPTQNVDLAAQRLARVRAKPVVWIGSERHDSLVVYGFVKDWSIAIPGRVLSTCSLEIEGLI